MSTDVGNVAVVAAFISAAAAIATGIVSALVSLSLSKRNRSQRIAEFRQQWIENLRTHVSEFVGVVHRVRNVSLSDEPAASKTKLFEQYNADLMRIESYISLQLNHDEAPSKRLVNVVAQSRGGAAFVSVTPQVAAFQRIDDHLNEVDAVTRIVLKWEWNRVRDEIKPFSKKERKRREEELLAKLELIPDSIQKHVKQGVK